MNQANRDTFSGSHREARLTVVLLGNGSGPQMQVSSSVDTRAVTGLEKNRFMNLALSHRFITQHCP